MNLLTQQVITELQDLSPDAQQQVLEFTKSLKPQTTSSSDPLARLKKSPLIGSFHGDPQLSAQSEEIVHSIWQKES
jgi:hypothetical protein